MFRACLIARVRRRWCVVHTPVRRRGTILPRSATKPCNRRTSRYGIASIFSVQNLQTFLRRKNLRPPGPPGPPGPPERGPPERGPDEGGAPPWGARWYVVSSAMLFPFPCGRLPETSPELWPDLEFVMRSPVRQRARAFRQHLRLRLQAVR